MKIWKLPDEQAFNLKDALDDDGIMTSIDTIQRVINLAVELGMVFPTSNDPKFLFTREQAAGVEKALRNGFVIRTNRKLPLPEEIMTVLSATDGIGYGRRYEMQAKAILQLFIHSLGDSA